MATRRRDLEPDYIEALAITIGNGEYFEVIVTNDDDTPKDLSSATGIKFAIKKNPADDLDAAAIVVIDLNLTDPDHDLPNGKVALKIADTDTDGKIPGKYYWDFRIELSAGITPKNWPKPAAEAILIQPVRRA
jgi:hypothetical protein